MNLFIFVFVFVCVQLQQEGILKSDNLLTRFFRISAEMSVDLCYRILNDQVNSFYVCI